MDRGEQKKHINVISLKKDSKIKKVVMCSGKIYYDLIEERGKALLAKLGLEKDSNRRVSEYSLGMKKRLALCIALLNEPEILVMDEPTSGLDPRGVKALRIVLKDLNKKGLTIILSSHVLTEVQEICSHVGLSLIHI